MTKTLKMTLLRHELFVSSNIVITQYESIWKVCYTNVLSILMTWFPYMQSWEILAYFISCNFCSVKMFNVISYLKCASHKCAYLWKKMPQCSTLMHKQQNVCHAAPEPCKLEIHRLSSNVDWWFNTIYKHISLVLDKLSP